MLFALLFIIASIIGLIKREQVKIVGLLSALASLALMVEAFSGIDVTCSFLGLEFAFMTDTISRYFCILVGISGLAVSLYTVEYMEPRHLNLAAYPVFILSMALIVLSRDFLGFIVFWELMTIASYVLIVTYYDNPETKRASLIYLVAMHAFNTAPLLLAIGAVYSKFGTLSYSALQGVYVPTWVIWAFLLGFMSKAGIFPIHFWLPEAHPVAPSNVSALLSGTMLKMAIYGMIRVVELFPGSEAIARTMVVLAILTIAIGAIMALVQKDIKRLMAYSSVDNMGYLFLALGAYIMLDGVLKKIAFLALLLHAFNHLVFKNLLFMLSGNVLHATGRKDLELRGLGRKMPFTAAMIVVGILSVSAVPPLNGFISKWLIYQATFLSKDPLLVGGGVISLFASALTLAAYIKIYRIFTGEPNVEAHEATPLMLAGEAILASLCVVAGIFPGIIARIINVDVGNPWLISIGGATFNALLFAGTLCSFIIAAAIALPTKKNLDAPWTTGEPVDEFEQKPEHMFTPIAKFGKKLSFIGERIEEKFSSFERWYSSKDLGYLDEIMFMPVIKLIEGTSYVIKELSKNLNALLAVTFLVLFTIVLTMAVLAGVI